MKNLASPSATAQLESLLEEMSSARSAPAASDVTNGNARLDVVLPFGYRLDLDFVRFCEGRTAVDGVRNRKRPSTATR